MRRSRVFALVASVGLATLVAARSAQAQAWTPPKGEASLTIGYGRTFADQHLDDQGNDLVVPWGGATWGNMTWNEGGTGLGYGITDRLAIHASLPFVVSKYEGVFPHPPLPDHQNEDDGSWHSAFGDFRAEVRFKATSGSLVVTPQVAFSTPSHYEYYAHATAGLGLAEGQVGVNVGRLLDPWISNGYVQARYTFTVPEKVLGISHNWSNVYLDAGYFVTSALTVSVIGEWQKTHGGWLMADIPPPTDPNFLYHDQLLRADHLRLGGGLSYTLTGSIEIGLAGYGTVYGHRDMNARGFTLSMTYNFSPSQLSKKGKTPMGRPGKPS